MATVQTIATTLTADARPAITSLRTFDAEVGKAFSRLDAMNKRAFSSTGGIGGGGGGAGGGGRNLASGFLELSRGIEDFSAAFQTGGLQGGLRGASNNLSQMAMVMGGPLAGAIAGLTVAALPSLVKWFDSSAEATKKLKEETDAAIKSIDQLFDARAASNVRGAGFAFDLKGMGDSRSAQSAIEQRQRESRELEEREFFNRKQRDAVAEKGGKGAFSKEITEELKRLDEERLALQERQLQTQGEIARLKEKERELRKQEDAEEFRNLIRKFQEEDRQNQEREDERRRRKQEQDQERLEGMLKGRLQGLGGKIDPLEGMDVPPELRDRIGGLLGEIDALNNRPRAQFAQVATADSQSLLRAQQQAKDSAERKREAERLRKLTEDILRELKEARRGNENKDLDDVNLI